MLFDRFMRRLRLAKAEAEYRSRDFKLASFNGVKFLAEDAWETANP